MVARSESTTGGCGGVRETRVFRCKTCFKEFSSFQALGGHRVGHKERTNNSWTSIKPMNSHTCQICGAEFHLGQALGGHMRKHRNKKEKSGEAALVTRSFLPEEPSSSTVTTLKKSSSGKRVDLRESFVNLKLELGLSLS